MRGKLLPTLFRAGFMGVAITLHRELVGRPARDLGRARRGGPTAPRPPGSSASPRGDPTSAAYESPDLTPDVFVRWAQLGAISPVFEVGGTGPNARPWELGPAAMDGLQARPSSTRSSSPTSTSSPAARTDRASPCLRPLGLQYPSDARRVGRHGGAPRRLEPSRGARDRTGDDAVRLPPGGRLERPRDRARVAGPTTFTRETPLDELPLYLRMVRDPLQPALAGRLAVAVAAAISFAPAEAAGCCPGPGTAPATRRSTARSSATPGGGSSCACAGPPRDRGARARPPRAEARAHRRKAVARSKSVAALRPQRGLAAGSRDAHTE